MELTHKDYKYIKNTGSLPGFVNGFGGTTAYQQYQSQNGVIGVAPGMHGSINPSKSISNLATQQGRNEYQKSLSYKKPSTLTGENNQSQADSAAAGAGPWFAIGSWLGGGVLEGINRLKTADQLVDEAGTSEANVGGISYTRQNVVNAGDIMNEYEESSAKDWLTNPGRAIASLFGNSYQRRQAQLAQYKSQTTAKDQRDNAYSKYLGLQNAKEYGNQDMQYLYGAKNGKMPIYSDGKPNALVSNGETLGVIDKNTGNILDITRVPGNVNNNDTNKVRLPETENLTSFVLSNKYNLSDQAQYDPVGALKRQAELQNAGLLESGANKTAKNGRLPKFKEGWWSNAIPSAIGSLMSLDQILEAGRNKPYKPNSYSNNPYEQEALQTLAGLRVNPYPITRGLLDAENRTNRLIDRSGGLSTAQRYLGRLSALHNTQNNIGNTLASIQNQNNQYLGNYASAALNAGQASRQAKMSAYQHDLDYYSKAHAARLGGQQMGLRNLLAQIQSYSANEFKRKRFNDTMSLYRDDYKLRQDELNYLGRGINNYSEDEWRRYGKLNGWV